MKAKEVMTKVVKTCTRDTNLADAARSMWMGNCGVLPIIDELGEVVGMITDRDVCIATGCRRRDPAAILVSEVMTEKLYSCSPESEISEALQIMGAKHVRRLPVIDPAGKLCGLLSMDDIARKIAGNPHATGPGEQEIYAALESIYGERAKARNESPGQASPAPQSKETIAGLETKAGPKTHQTKERTMHAHQPDVFETTQQKTNLWLKQISDRLHWNDHQKAYHGLRAVLHALRDRLPVTEAAHFGAQLPMLVRGIFYEDWRPASTRVKVKTTREFYDVVKEHFKADQNVNPMRLTTAVMQVLAANLSPGELAKLRRIMPPHLREIWPEPEPPVDLSDYV